MKFKITIISIYHEMLSPTAMVRFPADTSRYTERASEVQSSKARMKPPLPCWSAPAYLLRKQGKRMQEKSAKPPPSRASQPLPLDEPPSPPADILST